MSRGNKFVVVCLTLGLTIACGSSAVGQANRPARQHETLLLDIDSAAAKKVATVQNHLRVGQLNEAVELLRSIGDAHQGKLISVGSGRYVNVQNYVQMLAAGLPPEGLKIYRQQLDPALKPVFDAARESADESLLLKIVQQGYCCSFTDDALLLVGDLAWDAGDIWRARGYWQQILPPPKPAGPGEPVAWLAYPDSDLDPALVIARLILCSIQSGDSVEVRRDLAEFAKQYPDNKGHLAGRDGKLLAILQEVEREAEKWTVPIQTSIVETFTGSSSRDHVDTQALELGALRWQSGLKPFGQEQRRGFQQGSLGGLCYFPVAYGDIVLVNNDEHINAYRLQTGKPAWSDDPADARIYTSGFANPDGPQAPRAFEGLVGNIGLPRFTMTIADGRLYARMGSVQPFSNERGGLLVCLDLARGEGKLVWETFAQSLDQDGGGWVFEGSPLVVGGRAYVGLRRLNPQPQANIACFDALTGKLIWNRKLCVGQTNPNFTDFDVNQHLLTWGEGTLYYTTHMGAIAALEPQSGTIKWIVSYPRVEDTRFRHEYISRLQRGPLPAMFAEGVLYVAPIDSDEFMAFDAETGLLKWKRALNSPIHSVLGVSKGMVFVSGAELWGMATDSGKVLWKVGDPDPESHGFGRGVLVEDLIYWPTHEEIFVIEQATGLIRSRRPLFAVHGQYGGNLILADNHLLVAQPDRLAVFSDHGPPPARTRAPKPELSGHPAPASRAWQQARKYAENAEWGRAADQFQLVRQQAEANDEWMSRPLSLVAAEREADARLRQAWQLTRDQPTQAADLVAKMIRTRVEQSNRANLNVQCVSHEPSHQSAVRLQLRFPATSPPEMVTWLMSQCQQAFASPANADLVGPMSDASAAVEQILDQRDVLRRFITRDLSTHATEAKSESDLADGQPQHYHWPFRRIWQRSLPMNGRVVVPDGASHAKTAACVLINKAPLTSLNLNDGSVRWDLSLSHPLIWAGYSRDELVLVNSREARAVTLTDGRSRWRYQFSSLDNLSHCTPRDVISVSYQSGSSPQCATGNLITPSSEPPLAVSLSGDSLLVRQGPSKLIALDVRKGELLWHYAATRSFAEGWGLTPRHVILGQQSPPCLLILDRMNGLELARYPADASSWLRAPCVNTDGTFLTVGPLGRIDAWSKPGSAWQSDNGPLNWTREGTVSQSNILPAVLSNDRCTLILTDGRTLSAVEPHSGKPLWKQSLGPFQIEQARTAIHSDDHHVYVAADGILRSYSLATGDLIWERFLGPAALNWQVQLLDTAVIASPSRTNQYANAKIAICDKTTGIYLQRLNLTQRNSEVQIHAASNTTLISSSETLTAFGLGQSNEGIEGMGFEADP